MKEKYERADIEIVECSRDDIIICSGMDGDETDIIKDN